MYLTAKNFNYTLYTYLYMNRTIVKTLTYFSVLISIEVFIEGCTYMNSQYTLFTYLDMSHDMRFPTMWYVRPAKAQFSLRIRAV